MSKDSVERLLDVMINLLEKLPSRIADEMEKRHEIRKEMQVQAEIEFYSENRDEINKFMYGVNPKVSVVADNPNEQHIADQLAAVYNHKLMEGK